MGEDFPKDKIEKILYITQLHELVSSLPVGYNTDIGEGGNRLSGGQRQAIALSKAVFWGRKMVILDEPTAALGVRESQNALELIKILKEHNISIIVISHNLQHVFRVVDRIMVLRRGEKVGIKKAHETTADEIVKMITGADVLERV